MGNPESNNMDLQPASTRRAFYLLPLLMLVSQHSALVAAVPTPVEPIADSDKFLAANAIVPEAAPETMMVADSDGDVLVVPRDLLCVAREVVAFTGASDEEQDQIVRAQALQVLNDDSVTAATLMAVENYYELMNVPYGNGCEITSADNNAEANVRDANGNLINMEESAHTSEEGIGNETTVFQGDMLLTTEQLELIQTTEDGTQSFGSGTPWADGELKYCFHSHITSDLKSVIKTALEQTQQVLPCLKFTDVGLKSLGNGQAETSGGTAECNEGPAVFITSFNDGCWSHVGELSRKTQGFNLGPGCDSLGTVMHEFGHALGQGHEQSRPDRNENIIVHMDKISAGGQGQFGVNDQVGNEGDTSQQYDIMSLMHYEANAFIKQGVQGPVIETKAKGYSKYTTDPNEFHNYELGNRLGWAQSDANQLENQYKTVDSQCRASTLAVDTNTDATCISQPYSNHL